jgi:hypothetical protein
MHNAFFICIDRDAKEVFATMSCYIGEEKEKADDALDAILRMKEMCDVIQVSREEYDKHLSLL